MEVVPETDREIEKKKAEWYGFKVQSSRFKVECFE
jgi:hypothetical protein